MIGCNCDRCPYANINTPRGHHSSSPSFPAVRPHYINTSMNFDMQNVIVFKFTFQCYPFLRVLVKIMGKEKLCSLFSINSCFMHNWFYCGYISPFSFFIHSFILSSTKSFLEIQERWQIINEDHCIQEALSVEKEACEPTNVSNVIVP